VALATASLLATFSTVRYDLYKYGLILTLAALLGLMIGYPIETMFIAIIGLLAWQVHSLNQLYLWVKNPNKHPLSETKGQIYLLHRELNKSIETNRQRKKQISNYLKQFRSAISALPDAIVFIDTSGKIQWANRNARSLLGIRWPNDSELVFSDLVRDPSLDKLLSMPAKHVAAGSSINEQGLEFASPLNRELTLNIKVVPYTHDLRMVVARDVSRLVKVNRMHSDFVANVSHELKTPLTVLRGYLEILQSKLGGINDRESVSIFAKPLEQMASQSDRMQLIVNDLLYLSKLEDRQASSQQTLLNIDQTINSVVESLQGKTTDKNLKIELRLASDLKIIGNNSELHSAISNLIVNAISYTPKNGTICIEWQAINGDAHLVIADNGIGISESHIPRLTERFYRIDEDRSRDGGGTGLGLAIVKHVLQRHDAVLEIDSKLGKGSTFRCIFHRLLPEIE